jgi:hypothetical protein
MPEQVKRAHVCGHDDDPLPAIVGIAHGRDYMGRYRHECYQLFSGEMWQAEQFAEVSRGHAKDSLRHGLQLRPRDFWPQNLTEIGDDICSIDRSEPDPEIPAPIGDAVAHAIR